MFNIFKYLKKKPAMIPRTSYRLDVKEDITAYELYRITTPKTFFSYSHMESWYKDLPDGAKRHLKPETVKQ